MGALIMVQAWLRRSHASGPIMAEASPEKPVAIRPNRRCRLQQVYIYTSILLYMSRGAAVKTVRRRPHILPKSFGLM